jgi:translocation protein SEC63
VLSFSYSFPSHLYAFPPSLSHQPEALTDDAARENWEKYGNPDGKQSFEFSIGLPTFFAEKDNHNLILIFYLVLMVVVVPSVVWAYWRDSQM